MHIHKSHLSYQANALKIHVRTSWCKVTYDVGPTDCWIRSQSLIIWSQLPSPRPLVAATVDQNTHTDSYYTFYRSTCKSYCMFLCRLTDVCIVTHDSWVKFHLTFGVYWLSDDGCLGQVKVYINCHRIGSWCLITISKLLTSQLNRLIKERRQSYTCT